MLHRSIGGPVFASVALLVAACHPSGTSVSPPRSEARARALDRVGARDRTADPPRPARRAEARWVMPKRVAMAIELADRGELGQAEKLLRQELAQVPRERRVRFILAAVLQKQGKLDGAAKLLEEGIRGVADDFPLIMLLAEIREQQSQDGLGIERTSSYVSYKPNVDAAADKAFKQKAAEQALAAFQAAWKAGPENLHAAQGVARLLGQLGRHAEAARAWRLLAKAVPKDASMQEKLGAALVATGSTLEGVKAYERAVATDPSLVASHRALAALYQKVGQAARAKEHAERAEFHGWAPAFLQVGFTPQLLATLRALNDKDARVRKKTFQALLAEVSDASSRMIAAVAWHHTGHGAEEGKAFDALVARRESKLLGLLADHPRSLCTLQQAVTGLAKLKAPGTFERLVELLPRATNVFLYGIPGAFPVLGDPRGVEQLAKVLTWRIRAKADDSPMASFEATGAEMLRYRAILALGAYRLPAADRVLLKLLERADLAGYARVALYVSTREAAHLTAARTWLGKNRGAFLHIMQTALEDIATPEARAFLIRLKRLEAEIEKERERGEGKP